MTNILVLWWYVVTLLAMYDTVVVKNVIPVKIDALNVVAGMGFKVFPYCGFYNSLNL